MPARRGNTGLDERRRFDISRMMEETEAASVFNALSHPTRVSLLRHLMQSAPEGIPAGALAELLVMPPSTLSHHLAALDAVGLVISERRQRHILYAAAPDRVASLIGFLVEDCCGGSTTLCLPPASNGEG